MDSEAGRQTNMHFNMVTCVVFNSKMTGEINANIRKRMN